MTSWPLISCPFSHSSASSRPRQRVTAVVTKHPAMSSSPGEGERICIGLVKMDVQRAYFCRTFLAKFENENFLKHVEGNLVPLQSKLNIYRYCARGNNL